MKKLLQKHLHRSYNHYVAVSWKIRIVLSGGNVWNKSYFQNKKATTWRLKKKEATVNFYGKCCLPVIKCSKKHSLKQVLTTTCALDKKCFAAPTVIKCYKKHSLKQVLTTTCALDKKCFAAPTFEDLWVDPFQGD